MSQNGCGHGHHHSILFYGGCDLMGKGGHAHLSTLVDSSLPSREGLSIDYDNYHPHLRTFLSVLCTRKGRVMATEGDRRWASMATTFSLAFTRFALMGEGDHAHLSTLAESNLLSREG